MYESSCTMVRVSLQHLFIQLYKVYSFRSKETSLFRFCYGCKVSKSCDNKIMCLELGKKFIWIFVWETFWGNDHFEDRE
jgi:hypothetical protein